VTILAGVTTPYSLPYPGDADVADVPQHIKALAEKVRDALDGKLTKAIADGYYQKKITVQAPGVAMPSSPAPGDIVFVVP
jgi:hypothetical protein